MLFTWGDVTEMASILMSYGSDERKLGRPLCCPEREAVTELGRLSLPPSSRAAARFPGGQAACVPREGHRLQGPRCHRALLESLGAPWSWRSLHPHGLPATACL